MDACRSGVMADTQEKTVRETPAPDLPPPRPQHVDEAIAQAEQDHYRRLAARRAA